MPERGRGQRRHGRGPAGAERAPGRQLLGVAAEEALAERALALHQEHHGTATATLLMMMTRDGGETSSEEQ